MFWSVIAAVILMSVSWTQDVTGELSSPPNPMEGNEAVSFQQEINHFQSQLQDLQSNFNLQQQENSQLRTSVSLLLATVSQLQTIVTELQHAVPSQNTTTSEVQNQSTSLTLMQSYLESFSASYNASVRDLQSSFAQLQDKVTELDDVNIELQTTLLHSQELQQNAIGVQGNVTEFLCEHFTHSNVSVAGNVTAGTAVIRGRDWTYGEQDGHDHVTGVVMDKHTPAGLAYVHWENGLENIYRVGYAGGFDLYYYYPDVLRKFRHVLCQN
ncbi:uncharacterized protein LOC110456792 [Mizuhopecten yessoensis]|uniref:E3 ubiquitin-protein ligase MIB2 n=1 Tax=Mizuhopecten yessoensis TaxID=6573 RepID=A0A210QA88_MIZYE|nr:uncharacterized protein LOC110456792 [Mizuhopecten yessoensis]OWF45650.1 E3 ubiquitin-protein ligase MIB2 [Mizuhopecten yessoensis]